MGKASSAKKPSEIGEERMANISKVKAVVLQTISPQSWTERLRIRRDRHRRRKESMTPRRKKEVKCS